MKESIKLILTIFNRGPHQIKTSKWYDGSGKLEITYRYSHPIMLVQNVPLWLSITGLIYGLCCTIYIHIKMVNGVSKHQKVNIGADFYYSNFYGTMGAIPFMQFVTNMILERNDISTLIKLLAFLNWEISKTYELLNNFVEYMANVCQSFFNKWTMFEICLR